jgi:hypothetical protein
MLLCTTSPPPMCLRISLMDKLLTARLWLTVPPPCDRPGSTAPSPPGARGRSAPRAASASRTASSSWAPPARATAASCGTRTRAASRAPRCRSGSHAAGAYTTTTVMTPGASPPCCCFAVHHTHSFSVHRILFGLVRLMSAAARARHRPMLQCQPAMPRTRLPRKRGQRRVSHHVLVRERDCEGAPREPPRSGPARPQHVLPRPRDGDVHVPLLAGARRGFIGPLTTDHDSPAQPAAKPHINIVL